MLPVRYPILAMAMALLAGCKPSANPPGPEEPEPEWIGMWADLSNAPGTDPRVCCFYDSTRADPCAPDTLILRADGTLTFTSIPDEPSHFTIAGDTLYRFRGYNFDDTLRYGYSMNRDTLYFPITPLCGGKSLPARFRKVP